MDEEILRQRGLKVTEARMKILEILSDQHAHLSADQIASMLEKSGFSSVSLATVYRVLTQFHEAGLIHKHQFEDGASVYELADDDHHDHIVCERCGKIEEFFDAKIEKSQERVARELGYTLKGHTMVLYGICSLCAGKEDR